jgi:2-polyprenyl-6-methoxyphenol hydroxylase-like FAD-dependent oxidoreductase
MGKKFWTRTPGVVLLGDAAHVTTPNGEGVNHAMMDAMVLFEHIMAQLGGSDGYNAQDDAVALERAIIAYEADMRPRAYESILDSLNFENVMHKEDGVLQILKMFGKGKSRTGVRATFACN